MTSNDFPIQTWFETFTRDLRSPQTGMGPWPGSPLAMVLEAMSDASPEQFVNPLVAMHLRRFGASWARERGFVDRLFWVRSEWQKVDLCYGLATPFEGDDFNDAWNRHATGDLGEIETKIWYSHLSSPIGTVAAQIQKLREWDAGLPAHEQRKVAQHFHALVLLFQHRGSDQLARMEAEVRNQKDLKLVGQFVRVAEMEEVGQLWPTRNGEAYRGSLSLGLLQCTE